jgi:heptosyltransferase-2
MLCATPGIRAIRRRFPEARILIVTAPINHEVVLNNPDVDEFLLYDKRRVRSSPQEAWRFLRRLRGFGADCAFVLNTVSFSATSAWIGALSGARWLVGGSGHYFGSDLSGWLYSVEMPVEGEVREHAVDHALRPLEALGIAATDRQPVLVPPQAAVDRARRFLAGLGPGPLAVMHPGAGKQRNRWAPERFAAAARFLEERGATVWLVQGPADAAAIEETLQALGGTRPVLVGESVPVVAAAIGESQVALVNDTGVMHVAGAMRIPAVALFGPTPARFWAPRNEELTALQSSDGTMGGLAVDEVCAVLEEKLERGRELHPRS